MSEHLILVEHETDWRPAFPALRVMRARDYLEQPPLVEKGPLRVINLCRDYSYLSVGYYCSLLAEARRHKVVPTVRTIQDLSRKAIYSLETADLDSQVNKVLSRRRDGLQPTAFELTILFGQTAVKEMQDIARQIFELFRAPLLKVEFRLHGNWRVGGIRALALDALGKSDEEAFVAALQAHLTRPWRSRRTTNAARYDLAILYNPDEALPPSNLRALKAFIRAAKSLDLDAELIQRKDYARLAEYDALFIRETTRIDHYTYQFAKKADSEGMVVLDDPDSILKCTNKVYLAELLRHHKVPTPRTVIFGKGDLDDVERELSYPVVLKIPDGSFSRGVYKAADRGEAQAIAKRLFRESDLILAQEFLPTAFDWRIGVLNRTPIFACQYYMSKKHWQVVDHSRGGRPREGGFKTFAIADVPRPIVRTALRAADLIGDGLYGVDLKQTSDGVYVIEVNDNPNLDAGIEDAVLKDELYRLIMRDFLRRLDVLRQSRRRGERAIATAGGG